MRTGYHVYQTRRGEGGRWLSDLVEASDVVMSMRLTYGDHVEVMVD